MPLFLSPLGVATTYTHEINIPNKSQSIELWRVIGIAHVSQFILWKRTSWNNMINMVAS